MADSLPSPPISRSSTPESENDKKNSHLSQELDNLLEQYLEFLDAYTKLREDLSKSLSAGFFSLAQAQRATTLGSGRRYGQECYDQRMKAQRLVQISDHESRSMEIHVQKRSPKRASEETVKTVQDSQKANVPVENNTDNADSQHAESTAQSGQTQIKQEPADRDPITWFGILAPPALRQTQSSFVKTTEQIIPALLTVDAHMRWLEERIWTLREELGLMSDYGSIGPEIDICDVEDRVAELNLTKTSKSSVSGARKIPQKSVHGKVTLLKLGD